MVAKDTADLIRGLLVLDTRYGNVPQWTHLHEPGRLMTAATAACEYLSKLSLDKSADARGWRPAPGVITGPALPGLSGVLQAQHNVVVHLMHFPSAINLRYVLIEQATLSHRAARLARTMSSPLASAFHERAALHRELVVASRVLGGQTGDGRLAAAESAGARRMADDPSAGVNAERALRQLDHLSERVDVRIAASIEHGFREKL